MFDNLLFCIFKKKRNLDYLDYLEIHVVDHCNLNCAGCCHFAPIAKRYFVQKDILARDLARLSQLSNGNIRRIRLMGGEPLLHPEITDLFIIARRYFEKSEIAIHSNGILLCNMNDSFWEKCSQYDIGIVLTYYPVGIDYAKIRELATLHGLKLTMEIESGIKLFRKFNLDLKGKQSYLWSWVNCTHANSSVNLYNGKLYTCDIVAHSKHLSQFFGINLKYDTRDYIDIHKESSMSSILKKLNMPHPFCRYCRPLKRTIIEWGRTEYKVSEWGLL